MSVEVHIRQGFRGFDLDVRFEAPVGLTVLFGSSGSGKTSVINAVAGLSKPKKSRVVVNDAVLSDSAAGVWVPTHQRSLGYVFQEGRLFPHMSVRKNLMYGNGLAKARPEVASFDQVVDILGIAALLERRPSELSGGEKQRVAIGRALLARPKLILADEPLAALDEPRKAEILPYFERLRDEFSLPILYVTHSIAEVARLATTVVALKEGKVDRVGTAAEVLSDPSFTPMGPRAVGAVLEAVVAQHHEDGLTELSANGVALMLPEVGHPTGHKVRVRVAAHDVILSREAPKGLSALNIVEGKVHSVRSGGGPGAIVSVDTKAGRILARITRRSAAALELSEGVRCYAVMKSVSVAPQDIGTR
ncbi:molybdenum ABC transporter ATP-binding protein [Shimia sagamensis]|uniref:Molybdate transport system ATP-binding protein n=1 Tax=Shimia sagamensis TaxID=1566352 RepID=A0ABY1P816_9RHOB|nr:molybdenum ABC transporter ATP-binding protein [Shimia sagamensis]SMP28466.1 molybdate transport system ATP-binding protein [Shimia sagamensis]